MCAVCVRLFCISAEKSNENSQGDAVLCCNNNSSSSSGSDGDGDDDGGTDMSIKAPTATAITTMKTTKKIMKTGKII